MRIQRVYVHPKEQRLETCFTEVYIYQNFHQVVLQLVSRCNFKNSNYSLVVL